MFQTTDYRLHPFLHTVKMAKSEVWRHFEMGKADDGCKTGTCRLCDDPPVLRCSGHSTVGLWNHLLKIHKEEHDKLKLKKDDVKINKVVR